MLVAASNEGHMIHIYFLVLNLATGGQLVGESNETYDTMDACKAAVEERVAKVNELVKEQNYVVAEAKCDTEENMHPKSP